MAIVEKGVNFGPGANIKSKGYRLGKRAKVLTGKSQKVLSKGAGRIARSYKKYGKPTEMLFRKTGAGVLGVGKFALKRGALGFPGLVATGVGLGFKRAVRKSSRSLKFSPYNQFDKKARKRI